MIGHPTERPNTGRSAREERTRTAELVLIVSWDYGIVIGCVFCRCLCSAQRYRHDLEIEHGRHATANIAEAI